MTGALALNSVFANALFAACASLIRFMICGIYTFSRDQWVNRSVLNCKKKRYCYLVIFFPELICPFSQDIPSSSSIWDLKTTSLKLWHANKSGRSVIPYSINSKNIGPMVEQHCLLKFNCTAALSFGILQTFDKFIWRSFEVGIMFTIDFLFKYAWLFCQISTEFIFYPISLFDTGTINVLMSANAVARCRSKYEMRYKQCTTVGSTWVCLLIIHCDKWWWQYKP